MAAITSAVVGGGSLLLGAYEGKKGREYAKNAANQQAAGVEAARGDTLAATQRARAALDPYGYQNTAVGPIAPGQTAQTLNAPDPRQDYLQGIESGLQFTNQGFGQAQNTLSPLASLAQPYVDEQYNLLGMGGQDAQQSALGRISDPMQAEQERAFMRNNAALGGVGGNALSALAEQTRSRTEANLGNRLNQLAQAGSPALNALQQQSNMQLNQGLRMADIMQGGGAGLSQMETNRRQALANAELGQGSQLAQLSQNLGTAQAGGAAYAANNPSPLTQGLTAGLNAFSGIGGFDAWNNRLENNRVGNSGFNAINNAGLF
jgi:hypothetical protein